MGHTLAGDEILKNSFANFAFENFEIAAYKSLSPWRMPAATVQRRLHFRRTLPKKKRWRSGSVKISWQ